MESSYKFGNKTLVLERKVDDHIKAHNNPHGVTKYQLGLGNVDNKASADIVKEAETYSDKYFANNLEIVQEDDIVTIRFLNKGEESGDPEVIAEQQFSIVSESLTIQNIEFVQADPEVSSDVNKLKVWYLGSEQPLVCEVPNIVAKNVFDSTINNLSTRIDEKGNIQDILVNGNSVVDPQDNIAKLSLKTINHTSIVGTGNIDVHAQTAFTIITDGGNITYILERGSSTTFTSKNINSLTLNFPEIREDNLDFGYLSEINFYGELHSENITINAPQSLPVRFVRYGRRIDTLELDQAAVNNLLFYHDGLELICYISTVQYHA